MIAAAGRLPAHPWVVARALLRVNCFLVSRAEAWLGGSCASIYSMNLPPDCSLTDIYCLLFNKGATKKSELCSVM